MLSPVNGLVNRFNKDIFNDYLLEELISQNFINKVNYLLMKVRVLELGPAKV